MDTLFRLVSLQPDHISFNNSAETSTRTTTTTTTASSVSDATNNLTISSLYPECCNPFMEDDDFSSSSSKYYCPYQAAAANSSEQIPYDYRRVRPPVPPQFTSSTHPPPNWAGTLLADCAQAVAAGDSARTQQLLWMLNELSSPYGDVDQKLAFYFLQALFARVTDAGGSTHRTLCSAAEKEISFESTRKNMLRFQEASPWVTFGHVAANGAILEALDGENRLHIVDVSTTNCTQWPTLLEALATRSDDTPHLRLTSIVLNDGSSMQKVMKEISQRIEKFARLMGVPFKFSVVYCDENGLRESVLDRIETDPGEAVAVNCVGALRRVPPGSRRDMFVYGLRRLRPKVVVLVEEEAEFGGDHEDDGEAGMAGFVVEFRECLRFFSAYLESLDGSFSKTCNERLALERAAGRAIVDVVSCPAAESVERRETARGWCRRLGSAGFSPSPFSEDVADDVRALLRRYKEGWSMSPAGDSPGIFLSWKEQPVVWASAWKP